MRRRHHALLCSVLVLALTSCSTGSSGDPDSGGSDGGAAASIGLDEIQVLSTHNSYKVAPEPDLLDALRGVLGDEADQLDYTHRPLDEQLDRGVRHLELDVFADRAEGGHYAEPRLIEALGLEAMDPDFREPGLKALHVQEVDYRSTCPLLTSCLQAVLDWSEANPGHLPVTIQIEAKDDPIPDPADLGFVEPRPWTRETFAELEAEILSVLPRDRIITPGEVRGDAATLREAVRDGDGGGWPTLDAARGRVMFTLDDTGEERDLYRTEVPDVADRLIFVDARPPDDDAAVAVVNDPVEEGDEIRDLVAQGLLVRTRADADTLEARSGDVTRRDAAWDSGAHFVTTDYPEPDERFDTGYQVEVPGDGVARCNPLSSGSTCTDDALEDVQG